MPRRAAAMFAERSWETRSVMLGLCAKAVRATRAQVPLHNAVSYIVDA